MLKIYERYEIMVSTDIISHYASGNAIKPRTGSNVAQPSALFKHTKTFLEEDKVKIAMVRVAMLAERQLNYLFHDRINNILPPFLNLGTLGLNYGMQACQFTATSTTAECQTLAMPNYVHSIPNNNDNQDIVSMGTNSALLAKTVIENSYQVMAIQFMGMAQAVDYLKIQEKLSPKSRQVYDEIRSFFPVFTNDTPKYKEIEAMIAYLKKENK